MASTQSLLYPAFPWTGSPLLAKAASAHSSPLPLGTLDSRMACLFPDTLLSLSKVLATHETRYARRLLAISECSGRFASNPRKLSSPACSRKSCLSSSDSCKHCPGLLPVFSSLLASAAHLCSQSLVNSEPDLSWTSPPNLSPLTSALLSKALVSSPDIAFSALLTAPSQKETY